MFLAGGLCVAILMGAPATGEYVPGRRYWVVWFHIYHSCALYDTPRSPRVCVEPGAGGGGEGEGAGDGQDQQLVGR